MTYKIAKNALARLMDFKADERRDDPARLPDIRGPYEILHLRKYGRLPEGIWNLRVEESRSGLLWQALSGALDAREHQPFASAYIALALDNGLSPEDYRRELIALNKRFGDHLERGNFTSDHHHGVMRATYARVSCAQCSTLTALACQDPEMHDLFVKELLPLKTPKERMEYLRIKGFAPLLDAMIPDKPALKL